MDFLGQLAPPERALLLALARRRRLSRGEFVFRVGDTRRGVYALLRGRLKFFRIAPDGREVILWFCHPGEVFGISEVPAAKGRRVNVEACEDSEVARVADVAFNRFLDEHPAASRLCRRVMAARLGMLTNTLVNLVAEGAYARIGKLLLHLHGSGTNGSDIAMSHQEIASMTGTNRQTVTSVLGDLRRHRALSIKRRRIHIDNAALLDRLVHASSR